MDISRLCIFAIIFICKNIEGSPLRVVGGYDAPLEYGRIYASLQNLTGYHVCGGAVISNQHVITAAHCVQGAYPQYIKVVVGTTNLDVGGKKYDVMSINIHADFNISLRINDIAILRVTQQFDDKLVDVLKIENKELVEGQSIILTGYGSEQANGESSHQMHALNLTVFNQETCRYAMRYTKEVYDTMFCTFTQIGQGTCHGDSGGPLIRDDALVGIVSWGIPCARGFPDVHTRITSYIEWIQKGIKK